MELNINVKSKSSRARSSAFWLYATLFFACQFKARSTRNIARYPIPIYLTVFGEIRTVLPFCHTASERLVFLCRSTTCRTAFFSAASALSCKDILFFIRHLAPFRIILNNSSLISSLWPFRRFAINTGFALELSNNVQVSNNDSYNLKKLLMPRTNRRRTSSAVTLCPPSLTLSLIRSIANSGLGIHKKNKCNA